MKDLFLSIIVPIYNKAVYISPLINTIITSGLDVSSYEIVLINDGSTDKSAEICHQIIDSYKNLIIVYIEQPNLGVSAARNIGIEKARGTYIHFVDADDSLVAGAYDFLKNHFSSYRADFIGFEIIWRDLRLNNLMSIYFDNPEGGGKHMERR